MNEDFTLSNAFAYEGSAFHLFWNSKRDFRLSLWSLSGLDLRWPESWSFTRVDGTVFEYERGYGGEFG